MSIEDVVKAVADCVNTFKKLEETKTLSEGCLESFRSRARDIPALMFSRGLAYALVYVASRSNADAFKVGLKEEACGRLGEEIAKKYKKKEECSYALYGALLAYAMRICGAAEKTTEDPFSKLVERALKDPIVNARALEIAEWIKRFAEAYIEAKST